MFLAIYRLPLVLIAVFLVLAPICWGLFSSLFRVPTRRLINFLLFIAFVAIVVARTVLTRSGGSYGVELRPLYSFVYAKIQPEMYRSMLMNVAFFVPFGLTFCYCRKKRKLNILITIIAAALVSVVVEAAQYYYSLGVCEVDDVLCNTLGAAIGATSRHITAVWTGKINYGEI